jgi:hypothetical protein
MEGGYREDSPKKVRDATQGLSPRAIRLNRWMASLSGLAFIASAIRRHDYWGTTFGTLIFVWVALRRLAQRAPAAGPSAVG